MKNQEKNIVGAEIKRLRTALRLSLLDVGLAAGIDPATVNKVENGQQNPRITTLNKIAAALGTTAEALYADHHGYGQPDARTGTPVFGEVQGGDDGYLADVSEPDGYIEYTSGSHKAYALHVKGDSMRPRIAPGEFIVCDPDARPVPGDTVVIRIDDGRRMVKTYLYPREGNVALGSVNENHPTLTLAAESITQMHKVIAIVTSGVKWMHNALQ